ncbi:MAG: carbamoyltransferase [Candidatus Taylorbacteria bacterium]|nr:carbamoyltransferase [Candidatus Taylorbacteria bacterium]
MKNIILGINDSHDASAAIVIDGQLIAAVSEERFQRIKSMGGFPKNAIEECLKLANVTKSDIDYVVLGSNHVSVDNLYNIVPTLSIADLYRLEEQYWQPTLYQGKKIRLKDVFPAYKPKGKLYYPITSVPFGFDRDLDAKTVEKVDKLRKKFTAEYFHLPEERVVSIDHHTAHAYYAYWAHPNRRVKKDILVMTADAGGDGAYESVNIFRDGKFDCIYKGHTCLVATTYSYITLLLGMRPNEHEYKIMGLAPYAKPHEKKGPYDIFKESLSVDGLRFKSNPAVKDHFKYFADRLKVYRFDGIAGGLQDFAENLITTWVRNAVKKTGIGDIALSGGLFLNIKINKAIMEMPEVKSLFVPPGLGDESLAIGACYAMIDSLGQKETKTITPLKSAYLGSATDKEEIDELLAHPIIKSRYKVKKNATPDDVARVLAKGEICAIFQGAMEFGPRALGHRSIIADPSKPESVKKINEAIKMRDFWMPFTPSVLAERLKDYVIRPKEITDNYMTVSFNTTALGRKHLIAAIHPYDLSARPQRVEKTIAPEYHAIIKAFEKLTGIGAVLNTSLNIHGKPIVRKPIEIADEILSNADVELDNIYVEGILLSRLKKSKA